MNKILIIFLGLIIFNGCSISNDNSITDFKLILDNKEQYMNKNITIKGEYFTQALGLGFEHYLIDNNELRIRFKPKYDRSWEKGKTYSISGNYTNIEERFNQRYVGLLEK